MKVSVVGASDLGATIAQKLVEKEVCDEVVLYDEIEGLARGKTLDILQSSPVLGFRTKLVGTEHSESLSDSGIIIISDFFKEDADAIHDEAPASKFLRQLRPITSGSIFIGADTFSTRLLTLALDLGLSETSKLIGSSPVAMTAAITHVIARETASPHQEIGFPLLGLPPDGLIIPWSMVTLSHVPIEQGRTASMKRQIYDKMKGMWPLRAQVLGSAACLICQDILEDRRATRPCFAFTRGEFNVKNVFFIVPARIGGPGVTEIMEIAIDPVHKVALENVSVSGGRYGTRL